VPAVGFRDGRQDCPSIGAVAAPARLSTTADLAGDVSVRNALALRGRPGHDHFAQTRRAARARSYSSADERDYFGWRDAREASPGRLAEMFIARFPDVAAAGRGSDWSYAGWYVEMLHLTYPDALPVAYADYDLPTDWLTTVGGNVPVRIPLPPPGEADR
jgi:hypothetical protein